MERRVHIREVRGFEPLRAHRGNQRQHGYPKRGIRAALGRVFGEKGSYHKQHGLENLKRSLGQKNGPSDYPALCGVIGILFNQLEDARMKTQFSFSQAVEGYLLAANSRHLSPLTIRDYSITFRKFQDFIDDDPPIEGITPHRVEEFLAAQSVSKKTILNYHIGLSALWTWAVNEGLASDHILHRVERVKPEKRSIVPYSEDEIRAMLGALGRSRLYHRPRKMATDHALPHSERNRAIILLLLDTGIRASELCELRFNQINVRLQRITVFGKGSKERTIPFSARTGQALWKYLAIRRDDRAGNAVFQTLDGGPMDRDRLLRVLQNIGRRAGLQAVNVHRFRHTFAINFLRNGGNGYTLQMILGHTTMEMVRKYLNLAQADLQSAHRIASPVANMRL